MSNSDSPKISLPDPAELSATMVKVAERSQRLIETFVDQQKEGRNVSYSVLDTGVMTRTFQEWCQQIMANPQPVMEAQMRMWQDYATLWQNTTLRMMGQPVEEAVIAPQAGDRRFKDDAWNENPVFDFIKQSYLLAAGFVQESQAGDDGLDAHSAEKLRFYTRQFLDAMAPTNFAMTNPKVMQRTMETGGANLLNGLSNMLDDLDRGKGRLRIKMTDMDRFVLGENVAVTPGEVVYQNELMQLLQYTPTTDKVFRRPLLIIPPWINKYYILDLRAKNSFIKWAVDQGHTVFIISWVNPDASLAEKSFTDYMLEGPLAALDAIEQATGEREAKVIGYCLGGTLLASLLAYMAEQGGKRIKAATFFAAMVDFSAPGELGVFIDDEQISRMEVKMREDGVFEGSSMAEAFNLLRANDLIWSFVVNNYLLGDEPFPFDLLYWNSDSTRMPGNMHSFYMRNMYQHNRLVEPGGINLNGVDIDLRKIRTPSYILATKEDHIAPWESTYAATQIYQGTRRFVLGMSGHIAGVVNHPAANKYGYWVNPKLPASAAAWLAGAEQREGSWWPDWSAWVGRYNGKRVAARSPGDGALPVIEDAPGSYVKRRAD